MTDHLTGLLRVAAADDELKAAVIEWRHADEKRDYAEQERLIGAVDAYEAACDETGVKP